MTQVQNMTDQQLNRALAVLMYNARVCGRDTDSRVVIMGDFGEYNTHPLTGGWRTAVWRATEEEAWADIPNYSGDPAASLEVQAAAIAKDVDAYLSNLFDETCDPDKPIWTSKVVGRMMTASHRERAMAAYQVLKDHTATGYA
ncbi:hypothetical protein [Paenibacillus rhizophilus]|uniref:Phage ABA sandwich domain-containing protein n=1 Tax=Paenibacillus rhizophilus TaxID=1850366 RepID=A0A3N9P2I3_9BACL|nr:hypothetical protein [Paenibacillus rhizophilus]RQW09949.1 hypothetical protein EH198_17885 [Paenibacillus rhizophilus]